MARGPFINIQRGRDRIAHALISKRTIHRNGSLCRNSETISVVIQFLGNYRRNVLEARRSRSKENSQSCKFTREICAIQPIFHVRPYRTEDRGDGTGKILKKTRLLVDWMSVCYKTISRNAAECTELTDQVCRCRLTREPPEMDLLQGLHMGRNVRNPKEASEEYVEIRTPKEHPYGSPRVPVLLWNQKSQVRTSRSV